ncbi:MAG TPA: PDZ domain-containing protein [Candidatus Binataceae bacterium]|nr:PDZ domain-containing protein [Candidatus Binataceae bacterium]
MSASRDGNPPIQYLTIDEMMLKIAAMRAAAREKAASESPIPQAPGGQEAPVPQPEVVFPEYVSHCEIWARSGDVRRTRELKTPVGVNGVSLPREATPIRPQEYRPVAKPAATVPAVRRERPHYFLGSIAAIFSALTLALALAHLRPASPTMMMGVPAYGNLVAGGEPWNEFSGEDALVPAARPDLAPPHLRPKISPEQLEARVHQMLASNGFPDIGVSASHRGEVYLAGEVFSLEESDAIVKVAKLAANGGAVFFLHPEVREPQGSTFFGAIPEHAPEVWGARVRSVVIGSPAYKAGIVVGDVIREFGHATVGGANDLQKAVADHKPGERVTIRIWRNGAIKYSIARLTGLAEFASR